LTQPPQSLNRLQVLGLLDAFQKAMSALLACMNVAPPGGGPSAA